MFNRCWPASGWSRTPQLWLFDNDDDDDDDVDDEEKDDDDDEVNENENEDEDDDEDVDVEPSIIPSGWRETKRRDEEGRK